MHRSVRTTLRACALAMAAAAASLPLQAGAAPVPVKDFFDNSAFNGAVLAPDARSLAAVVAAEGKRDRLVVIDLASGAGKVVASFEQADIGRVEWVNNQRLVLTSRDKLTAPGNQDLAPGVYAVNRDGSDFKQLVETNTSDVVEHIVGRGPLSYNHFLTGQTGAQDSNAIYVYKARFDTNVGAADSVDLMKLDTVSGRATAVTRPGDTQWWLLDGKGEPRLSGTVDKNIGTINYLDPASGQWRKLASFDTFLGGADEFQPLGFAPDGTLYVLSNNGKDLSALYTFDFKTNHVNPTPVVALDGFDFQGELLAAGGKLLGIRYTSDAVTTAWFDAKMKTVQKAVDALMPATNNLLSVAARAELPLVLVDSYSDRQPHKYALYNMDTGTLNPVGAAHANINPADMGEQEFVRIKARDGASVPAWLTLPKGGKRKNLPLVVLVHGGPYVRGNSWGWDADDQFLASRGYAVLQPEFRGSTGFGDKHYRAGWKQWGLAMQDDIADATRWAIAHGIADPKRICIAGASYGGYAALMGLIKDPELYQCGIEWVGVTDLTLLQNGHWSFDDDGGKRYRKYGMPTLVGDAVADAAQFKATSPLQQAARLKQPLLMAYGAADKRVPLVHGRKFFEAVSSTNHSVQMVEYPGEGHGWTLSRNRIDFWTRVEAFLDKHIGQP